jgi:hypothetical protein
MRPFRRAQVTIVSVALGAAGMLIAPGSAVASTNQLAMFQAGPNLLTQPTQTMDRLRSLGVGVVRVIVSWSLVAPKPNSSTPPRGFHGTDPAAYPAAGWAPYDAVVKAAKTDGITVDFTPGSGAPIWAQGRDVPRRMRTSMYAWKPSPRLYGAFVTALGRRYSGTYKPRGQKAPLPRVGFWALYNEPNFGKNLAPQATSDSTVDSAAAMYRPLLDAGWRALQATGHGRDTILIGSLAARGEQTGPVRGFPHGLPDQYGTTKPLLFVRALYCVDSRFRRLRGGAARAIGCPTNAAGSRAFRGAHPALFTATGFAVHPYPKNLPPLEPSSNDPDYVEFADLPHLEGVLDRAERVYRSGTHFPIYITEYGYITNPPNHSANHFVSPPTAAVYTNWAEYLEWRMPRIATTMQFPLTDPNPWTAPEFGGFASGLLFFNGRQKPAYDAYRLPLFLPVTAASRGRSLEVWGCARPAHFATGPQKVNIEFQPASSRGFSTVKTVPITSPRGYFDVRVRFPASGSVRLEWTYPDGTVAESRVQRITEI